MNNCRRGFTLIETLIYLGIFALLVSVLVPSFFVFEYQSAHIEQNASLLSDRLFVDWYIRSLVEEAHEIVMPTADAFANEITVRTSVGHVVTLAKNASSTLELRRSGHEPIALHDPLWRVEDFVVERKTEASFGEVVTYSFGGNRASTSIFLYTHDALF